MATEDKRRAVVAPPKLTYADLQAKVYELNKVMEQVGKDDAALEMVSEKMLSEPTPERFSQYIEPFSDLIFAVYQLREDLADIALALELSNDPRAEKDLESAVNNLQAIGRHITFIYKTSQDLVGSVKDFDLKNKLSQKSQRFIFAWEKILKASENVPADFMSLMAEYRPQSSVKLDSPKPKFSSKAGDLSADLKEVKERGLKIGAHLKEKEQNSQLSLQPEDQYSPDEEQEESSYRPSSR